MTRKEIAKLLEVILAAYPNAKIKDAGATVSTWEMILGDFSAESVYKAARLHMETCKFFPTPADIRDKMVRADLMYSESPLETAKLQGASVKMIGEAKGWSDDKFDSFCRWIGLGYPNDCED